MRIEELILDGKSFASANCSVKDGNLTFEPRQASSRTQCERPSQVSRKTALQLIKLTPLRGFDESFNAITGLNGSGKSNILDAICFVLGITNMQSVCLRDHHA